MNAAAEPILFTPVYKDTLWGGTAFSSRLGRPLPAGKRYGESWEIVSHGADQALAASGSLSGRSLGEIVARCGESLLGPIETFGTFPLLYKFIDAQERLSVQVHPDDRQARSSGWGEFGKTECWYIVDAKPGAQIIVGFRKDMERDSIGQAIENAAFPDLLNFIPIRPGDLLFIPAGTVHAIMEGTLIYEVGQRSDATLRLYDWGRLDSSGRPRRLHVHDALAVIDTRAHDGFRISPVADDGKGYRHSYRVACRYFAIEEYAFSSEEEIILLPKRSFRVLTATSGSLGIGYPGGTVRIGSGGTVLLPAALREVRVRAAAGTVFLVSWVPDLFSEIVAPLRRQGIHDNRISALGGIPERNDLLKLLA